MKELNQHEIDQVSGGATWLENFMSILRSIFTKAKPTTLALGEEDSTKPTNTLAIGEDGSLISTKAIGEEGSALKSGEETQGPFGSL